MLSISPPRPKEKSTRENSIPQSRGDQPDPVHDIDDQLPGNLRREWSESPAHDWWRVDAPGDQKILYPPQIPDSA